MFERGNTAGALMVNVFMVTMVVAIRFLGVWLVTMLAVLLLALCQTYG